MTNYSPQDIAGDCRRAACLVTHHGRDNLEGINAILQEAVETDRVTPLIIAVLDLYQFLIPELRTEFGMKIMSDAVVRLATRESE